MANHVNTYVYFESISDAGKQKLEQLYTRIRKDTSYSWFGDMWVDGEEGSPSYEETEKYDWTTKVIGPKWSYLEDYGDDFMSLTSAWSAPLDGIDWVVQQIAEVDPNVIARVTYEDEFPNFFGAALYTADGQYDIEEWDDGELRTMLLEEHPEMAEHWDEDEEECDDEYWDMYQEHCWEKVNDVQNDAIVDMLKCIEDEKEMD